MISAKAYGVLRYLLDHPDDISAEALARVFKEERKYFLGALKELRNAGIIITAKTQINGRWTTYSRLSESVLGSPYSGLLSSQYQQNSNKNLILIHTDTVTNSPNESVRENGNVGYEFFGKQSTMDDEERYREAHKQRVKQQEFFQSEKAKYASDKRINRSERPKAEWSCLDVAYEFSDKTSEYWHIPPWSVNKSRFVQALGNMRKLHNTNGEIETEAIEWFFKSISVDKYNSGEHLWKMFIKQFPSLADEIKNVVREDEEISEESLLRTAKSFSILED